MRIVTYGNLIGSPYPWRREFNIKIEGSIKELYHEVKEFEIKLLDVYGALPDLYSLPPYEDYLKSFCKYCKLHEDHLDKCFRHSTLSEAMELIGAESNHEYVYLINNDKIEMHLGASHWIIELYPDKAIIERPSGATFEYRAHKNHKRNDFYITSHLYLALKTLDFFERIIDISYIKLVMV